MPTMALFNPPAGDLLAAGTGRLAAAGIDNAGQECRWILADLLAIGAGELAMHPEREVPAPVAARFETLVTRRATGEPLQYVMGTVEFHGLTLHVGPGVLAARSETELLVDHALRLRSIPGPLCDLCTGSGAIALALAAELPEVKIYGVDISPAALAYAQKNQKILQLDRVGFFLGDLFAGLPSDAGPFAVITANPPYVTEAEYATLEASVKDHEPELALVSGPDGLDLLRRIASEAPARLLPGGALICEIGSGQGQAAAAIFASAGFTAIEILQDYAGRDRFVAGRKPRG
jgi:release factor glutamine methyltransferase